MSEVPSSEQYAEIKRDADPLWHEIHCQLQAGLGVPKVEMNRLHWRAALQELEILRNELAELRRPTHAPVTSKERVKNERADFDAWARETAPDTYESVREAMWEAWKARSRQPDETTEKPVAWRAYIDSPYELGPRWFYWTDRPPNVEKPEPLYARPAVEPSGLCRRDDGHDWDKNGRCLHCPAEKANGDVDPTPEHLLKQGYRSGKVGDK